MALELSDLKGELRVTHSYEDVLIERKLQAAIAHVESYIGRTLVNRTHTYKLDSFPTGPIKLPRGPIVSVTSVKYVSPSTGLEVTLAADQYEVDTYSTPGWIAPAVSGWPSTMDTINAVSIVYVAGYGVDGDDVPVPLQEAVLKLGAHLYEWRGVATEGALSVTPAGFYGMLDPYRNWHA